MIWLKLIPYGITAILSAFITLQISSALYEARTTRMVEAERQICQANQKKTQEVSDALQKRLKATDARHAAYVKRLLKSKLQPAGTSSRHDAAAGSDRLPDADITLLGLGAAAEQQTSQLIACQDFVRKEREK